MIVLRYACVTQVTRGSPYVAIALRLRDDCVAQVTRGSPIGREISGFVHQKKVVPMRALLALLEAHMEAPPPAGLTIVDGFPRSVDDLAYFQVAPAD